MSDVSPRSSSPAESAEADRFTELRNLLLAEEHAELIELRRRLEDPTIRATDVSSVLADAVLLRTREDNQLAMALGPTVEDALHTSVRERPTVFANLLFPVMGPAIRQAIAAALRSMVQSIDRVLEHSLSMRSLRWRVEAWRTGKSFAEIVLRHALIYRVEQVFLIHRETGLPLVHRVAGDVTPQDSKMVSGMLTALQDFVRDSFHAPPTESLETLEFGELTLWIAQGPRALLAAVVRGHPSPELRALLYETLEAVHRVWGRELDEFLGDTAPFDATADRLDACLQVQYVTDGSQRSRRRFIALVVLILLALGYWAALAIRDSRRWNAYVDVLNAEPGIVVTAAGSRDGRYFVAGLRDPFATDPVQLLDQTKLSPDDVVGRWEPYYALVPAFVLARATAVLQPPETVQLTLEENVLVATGSAPHEWISETRRLARALPGVAGFRDDRLSNADWPRLALAIEAQRITFPIGQIEPTPGQGDAIAEWAANVRRLDDLAAEEGRTVRIEVVGRADRIGGPESRNIYLSERRAEAGARLLGLEGRPNLDWSLRGVGSADPVIEPGSDGDPALNRSVAVRVLLEPTAEVSR